MHFVTRGPCCFLMQRRSLRESMQQKLDRARVDDMFHFGKDSACQAFDSFVAANTQRARQQDGSRVDSGIHKVNRGTCDLDACMPLICDGGATRKVRKQRWMNVQDHAGELLHKRRTQQAHVAREQQVIDDARRRDRAAQRVRSIERRQIDA